MKRREPQVQDSRLFAFERPLPDSNRGWRICNPLPRRHKRHRGAGFRQGPGTGCTPGCTRPTERALDRPRASGRPRPRSIQVDSSLDCPARPYPGGCPGPGGYRPAAVGVDLGGKPIFRFGPGTALCCPGVFFVPGPDLVGLRVLLEPSRRGTSPGIGRGGPFSLFLSGSFRNPPGAGPDHRWVAGVH